MSMVDGYDLCQVREMVNYQSIFDKCISLLIKFAEVIKMKLFK